MQYIESALTQLECASCAQVFDANQPQRVCLACGGILLARYDFMTARASLTRQALLARPRGTWRWSEILPVRAAAFRLSLGEGETSLLKAGRLAERLGLRQLYIKDESTNPTGSVKVRGLAVALGRALELGLRQFAIADSADAGEALAAYAARAHVSAQVFLPKTAPQASQTQIRSMGADLSLVDALASQARNIPGRFDLSSLREPYRLEGAKTVGLELAEAFGWNLPEALICAGAEGLELMGIWKAFDELEQLGLIGALRPRLVWVRSAVDAPDLAPPENTALLSKLIDASHGVMLDVTPAEISECKKELAVFEGLLADSQGAACLAAARRLHSSAWLDKDERVLILNSGSGLKSL